MTPEALAAIQARADAAGKHSADLCSGKQYWRMSIPPRIDQDSDFVFGAVIDDVKSLLEALRESEADNARLRAQITFLRAAMEGVLEAMPDRYRPINEKQGAIDYARAALDEPSAEGWQA